MAGSLSDFKYVDNSGRTWLVRIDKSNALATGTGFVPITNADLTLDYLPRNIEMRYVTVHHPSRPIKRDIYIANKVCPIWLGNQNTIQLIDYQDRTFQSFRIGNRIQEKFKYRPHVTDTYQTDSP